MASAQNKLSRTAAWKEQKLAGCDLLKYGEIQGAVAHPAGNAVSVHRGGKYLVHHGIASKNSQVAGQWGQVGYAFRQMKSQRSAMLGHPIGVQV